MSKIKCYNCGEFDHFARDCPKARDNANIAQEREQKGKSESMLDLDNISVREECAVGSPQVSFPMCTLEIPQKLQYKFFCS